MLFLPPPRPPAFPSAIVLDSRPAEFAACADEAQRFAQVANWQLDLASGRIRVSRAWYGIWGFSPQDPPTLPRILERIHAADRARVEAALRLAGETGVPFQVRYRIHLPDGRIRWAESTGRRDVRQGGALGRLCGVVMDVTARHEAEQTLARYYEIVSASPDRIAFLDREGRIQAANAAFTAALGAPDARPPDRLDPGGPLAVLVDRHLNECLRREQLIIDDLRERAPSGQVRESEARLFPSHGEDGAVTGVVFMIRDVTEIREAERRLLQSAAVYEATTQGVLITDARVRIVAINAAFTRITGHSEPEILGHRPGALDSHWHTPAFFVGMWRALRHQGAWEGEIWLRRRDGEVYLQQLHIRRVLDPRGRVVNFVGVFAEPGALTGHRQAEYLAHHDPLTRLPNRLLFNARLDHALNLSRRKRGMLVLCLLDLDRFAHINASLSQQLGDELLRAMGLRLRETIRCTDTLARLSGNLFGLLFEEVPGAAEVELILRRLREKLRPCFVVRDHQIFVTVSLGVTCARGGESERAELMAQAETALRLVKEQGRDGVQFYTARPGDAAHERQQLTMQLRASLEQGEYVPHYRPRANCESGAWAGAAVSLGRGTGADGGLSAERFMQLARDTGFMLELGQWLLDAVCRQARDWQARGVSGWWPLSVPIDESQFMRGDLVRVLEGLLREYEVPGERIELEFGEALLYRHQEQAAELFAGLDRLGVRIALGGVGAGWIAPAALGRLPIRLLQIHPKFVAGLPEAPEALAVTQAVIALGQALDLELAADGVATDAQRLLLLNLGCPTVLGTLFAPPLPRDVFERRLRGRPEPVQARLLKS